MGKDNNIAASHRNTIMICEDDPGLLQTIEQIVGSKYITIAVGSGIECLSRYIDEKAKGNQIDVLLVDYELQDLPGDIIASTVRELSGNRRLTHTILIAAVGLDRELIEELKIKEYITKSLEKPICADALMAILEEVIP